MTREEWEAKQNISKKEYKYVQDGAPGQVKKVQITAEENEPVKDNETEEPIPVQLKEDWNAYLNWLDKKGMKGKPELDKGGLGNKLFEQYLKENPNTTLSVEQIPNIRKAYLQMREQGLKDYKEGKMSFSSGTTPENYMKHIVLNEQTENPNYVGQHLTQTPFPGQKFSIKDKKTGQVIKEVSTSQRPSSMEATTKMALEKLQ